MGIRINPGTEYALRELGIVPDANAASFLLLHLLLKTDPSWYGTIGQILDSGPRYIAGVFLLLTVAIEMPIVYNALKDKVRNRRVLQAAVIVSNMIKTAGVAVTEK